MLFDRCPHVRVGVLCKQGVNLNRLVEQGQAIFCDSPLPKVSLHLRMSDPCILVCRLLQLCCNLSKQAPVALRIAVYLQLQYSAPQMHSCKLSACCLSLTASLHSNGSCFSVTLWQLLSCHSFWPFKTGAASMLQVFISVLIISLLCQHANTCRALDSSSAPLHHSKTICSTLECACTAAGQPTGGVPAHATSPEEFGEWGGRRFRAVPPVHRLTICEHFCSSGLLSFAFSNLSDMTSDLCRQQSCRHRSRVFFCVCNLCLDAAGCNGCQCHARVACLSNAKCQVRSPCSECGCCWVQRRS